MPSEKVSSAGLYALFRADRSPQGAEAIDKLYGPVQDTPKKAVVVKKKGGDSDDEGLPGLFGAFLGAKMKEMKGSAEGVPLNEESIRFFKALFNTPRRDGSTEPGRRIIYMRNFQDIAGAAKPLMTYILHSLYAPSNSDNGSSESSDSGEDSSKESDSDASPSEDLPAPASKGADIIVFGTNDPGPLIVDASPSDSDKDRSVLSALFTHARSSIQGSKKSPTRKKARMATNASRFIRKMMDSDTDSSDSDGDEPKAKGKNVEGDPIRFDARLGKKTDDLVAGALKVSVFAANMKIGAVEEGWQKEAEAERIKALNKTVLSACLERAGGHTDEDIAAISSWDDAYVSLLFGNELLLTLRSRPSTGLLSVQDATSIVHPALGLMAAPIPAGGSSRTFKDCLEASYEVIEQRKKERADWARGIDPTNPQDTDSDSEKGTKAEEPKEVIDNLLKGVSSYARELKECIVDSGEYPQFHLDIG